MNTNEVQRIIIDVIEHIQQLSGRPATEITSTTRPLIDVAEFDSLNALEATLEISSRLGCNLAQDIGLFSQDNQVSTVADIASEVRRIMNEKERY